MEYRTPSGRLCPYADMTDDQLDDFEHWDSQLQAEQSESGKEFMATVLFLTFPFWMSGLVALFDFVVGN